MFTLGVPCNLHMGIFYLSIIYCQDLFLGLIYMDYYEHRVQEKKEKQGAGHIFQFDDKVFFEWVV